MYPVPNRSRVNLGCVPCFCSRSPFQSKCRSRHCYLEQHLVWNGEREWEHGKQPKLTRERLGKRYIMYKIYIWKQN